VAALGRAAVFDKAGVRALPRLHSSAAGQAGLRRRQALLALAAAPAIAAAQGVPCVLVFGHGRNGSGNEAANHSWNEVNRAFHAEVAHRLREAGTRVSTLLAPVEFGDVGTIIAGVLRRAESEGCSRIVETTVFADEADRLLIVRLRAYPVVKPAAAPTRIGEPVYTHRQDFQLTQRNLDRLIPAELARAMAADYLERQGR
jgi:hypothetical protein